MSCWLSHVSLYVDYFAKQRYPTGLRNEDAGGSCLEGPEKKTAEESDRKILILILERRGCGWERSFKRNHK
jgi:hypothetical protein